MFPVARHPQAWRRVLPARYSVITPTAGTGAPFFFDRERPQLFELFIFIIVIIIFTSQTFSQARPSGAATDTSKGPPRKRHTRRLNIKQPRNRKEKEVLMKHHKTVASN